MIILKNKNSYFILIIKIVVPFYTFILLELITYFCNLLHTYIHICIHICISEHAIKIRKIKTLIAFSGSFHTNST